MLFVAYKYWMREEDIRCNKYLVAVISEQWSVNKLTMDPATVSGTAKSEKCGIETAAEQLVPAVFRCPLITVH